METRLFLPWRHINRMSVRNPDWSPIGITDISVWVLDGSMPAKYPNLDYLCFYLKDNKQAEGQGRHPLIKRSNKARIKAIPLNVLYRILFPCGQCTLQSLKCISRMKKNLSWGLTYARRWPEVGRRGSIPRALPSAGWGGRWRWSRWGARPGSSPHTPETLTESPRPGTHSESTHTHTHGTVSIFHRNHLNVMVQYNSVSRDSSFMATDCDERIHNSAAHSGISNTIIPNVLDAHEECMTRHNMTLWTNNLFSFYNKTRGATLEAVRMSHHSKVADETRDQEFPSHSWMSVNISEDEL